jgi:hypothetical protein
MDKFSKEFYASRIEDWITKYIKVKELLQLIKSIEKDIEKNGGQIIRISDRKSTIYLEEFRPSILSSPLDRHSVGLGVLEGTDGLFNKNEKIFHTPLMYEINEAFKEIENLDYCDDIKIFLYFLTIEVHNVYVFYLSIEKNIFTRVNEHSYSRQKYNKMSKDELIEELSDLTDITYLMYSFYSYIDLNIEAIHEILKYFDDHFQILNHDISMHKLFFKKNLNKKESDLKYILSFKIIIESSALIESYYQEIMKINNNKEIKAKIKELKEVLSYLNEKNTDRVNDDIYEVYLKQKKTHYNNIIKQKKNIKIDMQSSFFIGQQEDYYRRLGEKQYDEEINIKTTKKNMINLVLLYLHTFIYSFFYIIPYISFYFYFLENDIQLYYLGAIITSTHIGNFLSKIIINYSERYKFRFIIFCLCYLISFSLTVFSEFFLENKDKEVSNLDKKLFIIVNLISRFIYGFSCCKLLTRKYIMLYLPESEIKYYSLIYLVVIYVGILFGIGIHFLSKVREPFSLDFLPFEIANYLFLFGIGFAITFVYLFFIIILFTEPSKDSMIMQNRITISTKDETSKDSINPEKNIFDFKPYEEKEKEKNNEEKAKSDRGKKSLYRSYNKDNQKISNKNDFNEDNNYSNIGFKEIEYKTYNDNKNRLIINRIESRQPTMEGEIFNNKDDELIITPLNISLIKRESNNKNNNINIDLEKDNNENKKYSGGDDLLSAEEIKGLNSLEKNIINFNTKNNYDDVNLLPEELDRIKKNQFKSNKSYLCSFIVFILSLLLTNSLNEYLLLSLPLFFLKSNYYDSKNYFLENEVILSILVLEIFSFPFIIVVRMIKSFNIERRMLLIFYLILYFLIVGFSACKYLFLKHIDEKTYSLKNILYQLGILIIFVISNLIECTTHLLSNKLIPSFVKICCINNKYLISYSTVIGKTLGGIIFSVLCLMDDFSDKKYKESKDISPFEKTNIFRKGIYIFCAFSVFSFFIFCICYKSLRVRAISKLFYISD